MIEIGATVALLICSGFLPLNLRLFIAIPVSIFQFYIPGIAVNGVPLPASVLATFSLWPEALKGSPRLLRWKMTIPLFGVLIAFLLSIAWSVDPKLGATIIIYWLSFLVIVSAAITISHATLVRQLNLTFWLGLVEVVLVIVFRWNPDLKVLFLQSDLATWFISNNVLDVLFTSAQNNVLSPSKSGGLFVNANVAAAYMAIVAFSWLALRDKPNIGRRTRPISYIALVAYLIGILLTGSKAASVMVGVFTIIYAWYVARLFPSSRKTIRHVLILAPFIITFTSIAYITYHLGATTSTFVEQSSDTFGTRLLIWNYGLHAFVSNPLLGQGFGGWQLGFDKYAMTNGLSSGYPPHNTLIYLWSQGSLIALILGAWFAIRLIWFLTQWLRSPSVRARTQDSAVFLAALLAFGWTFMQGMGSNFGLLGDQHMAPFLAVLLALVYQHSRRKDALPEDRKLRTGPSASTWEPAE